MVTVLLISLKISFRCLGSFSTSTYLDLGWLGLLHSFPWQWRWCIGARTLFLLGSQICLQWQLTDFHLISLIMYHWYHCANKSFGISWNTNIITCVCVILSWSAVWNTAIHGCPICPGGVLGQVSDRDAPHRSSTRNATRVKKGGRNYTFCPILMKNRGRNTTFSSFLLKYRGRNSTNFPETWKRGVETEEHI